MRRSAIEPKEKFQMRKSMLIFMLFILVALLSVQMVSAGPAACDSRVNNTHNKLLECVTIEGVRAHQAALQAIADANGGTRAAGTPGYDGSVAYVKDTLEAAGYDVELNGFPFTFVPPATLIQTAHGRLFRLRFWYSFGAGHPR
jgi:hypothetical protein